MTQIKYFAVNEEIENQIKSIRRTIYLSMNGICAENIDNSGLKYKQNFGVAWTRIVEIAQNYTQNYDLAERLWLMSIRETKLLATLLCPPQELTTERLTEWISGITTIELAEIFAFALLRKTTLTKQILQLEQSENHLYRLTAYHTLARQATQYLQHTKSEENEETIVKFLRALLKGMDYGSNPENFEEIAEYPRMFLTRKTSCNIRICSRCRSCPPKCYKQHCCKSIKKHQIYACRIGPCTERIVCSLKKSITQ